MNAPSSGPGLNFYRVYFDVLPATERPAFWDGKGGILVMWLFGSDERDAAIRARTIAEELPYRLPVPEANVAIIDDASTDPIERQHEEIARTIGLSLMLLEFLAPDLQTDSKIISFPA